MIKNLTLLLIVFGLTSIDAQTEKGSYIISTSTSFSLNSSKSKIKTANETTNSGSYSSIGLTPTVGYFVVDNLAVGAGIYFGYGKSEVNFLGLPEELVSVVKRTSIQFSPFVNYYFSNAKARPYISGSVGIGSAKDKSKMTNSEETDSTESLFSYRFGGGLAIFLNNSVAINLGLIYDSSTRQEKGSDENPEFINTSFGLRTGFSIFL